MNIVQGTVQEIAANIPGASELFDLYHIDFKTNAEHTLKEAISKNEISLFDLVEKLATLKRESILSNLTTSQHVSVSELISYILENYHEKHRMQFADAIRLTQNVTQIHSLHCDLPHGLEAHLAKMQFELEEHMMKEEQILFPMLLRGMHPSGPILVMECEHLEHEKALEQLRIITNNFVYPIDASTTWITLYQQLQELYFALKDHIYLENEVLFVSTI